MVWKAVQLILESVAFLLIGLQLPTVLDQLAGISPRMLLLASVVRSWPRWWWSGWCGIYLFAYPRLLSAKIRERESAPTPAQVLIVAWAGMRGVVSLAAAFGAADHAVRRTVPGRPHLIFLTFVVVLGTLLLHRLTPALAHRAARCSEATRPTPMPSRWRSPSSAPPATPLIALSRCSPSSKPRERSATHERVRRRSCAPGNTRRSNSAWEQLGRNDEEIGEARHRHSADCAEMLDAERRTFIAERDSGRIDDEVLRTVMRGLDLEEATLNRR